jgi:hypothetical protein
MNNEQYQQIIDEAYKNYLFTSEWFPISGVGGGFIGTKANSDEIMTQGLFINICKTDEEFSNKWGVTIYTEVDDDKVWMGIVYNNKAAKVQIK